MPLAYGAHSQVMPRFEMDFVALQILFIHCESPATDGVTTTIRSIFAAGPSPPRTCPLNDNNIVVYFRGDYINCVWCGDHSVYLFRVSLIIQNVLHYIGRLENQQLLVASHHQQWTLSSFFYLHLARGMTRNLHSLLFKWSRLKLLFASRVRCCTHSYHHHLPANSWWTEVWRRTGIYIRRVLFGFKICV